MKRRRRKKDSTDTESADYLAGPDDDDLTGDGHSVEDSAAPENSGDDADDPTGDGHDDPTGDGHDDPAGDPTGDGGDVEDSAAPENDTGDDAYGAPHGGFGQDDARDPLAAPLVDPPDATSADTTADDPDTAPDTDTGIDAEADIDAAAETDTESDEHHKPAPIPTIEPVDDTEPTEDEDGAVLTPDAQLAAVLTGAEHSAASDALKQLLAAEARGAAPDELCALFADSDVMTKWEQLRSTLETTHAALAEDPDAELGEHTQTAAQRLAAHTDTVCGRLAERLLGWRQAVLDAHCADFEALCEQATTTEPPDTGSAAAALAEIIDIDALRTITEWATAATADQTIGGAINAYCEPDVPSEAAAALDELRATPLAALLGHDPPTLSGLINDLLSRATNPELLTDRELAATPPGWAELAEKHNTNERAAQKTVTQDSKVLADLLATDHFRALRWAVSKLHTDMGIIAPAQSGTPAWWRARVGDNGFEMLRWLARYVPEDDTWLVHDTAAPRSRILRTIDNKAEHWLATATDLIALVPGLDPLAGAMLLAESTTWHDIGDSWYIRWDGTLAEKAAYVLELVGHPMHINDLIETIGTGTPEELVADLGDELGRVDRHFFIAPTAWGYTPYDDIAAWIDRNIDNAGGTASVAELIAGITRDFGTDFAEAAGTRIHGSGAYTINDDQISHWDNNPDPTP